MKIAYISLFCVSALMTSAFSYDGAYFEDKVYPAHTTISDASIESKLKTRLTTDPLLYNINVTTLVKDGVIYISGVVEYAIEAENMVSVAYSIKGVKDIDVCCLRIKKSKEASHLMLNDDYITAKIKGALIRENLLNDPGWRAVTIETEHGVVYLRGCVNSHTLVNKLIEVAKSVKETVKVVSAIKVGK